MPAAVTPADTPFAQALKAWCHGRNQADAAEKLGCHANTLRTWITGDSVPPKTRRAHVAATIGISPSAITR